METTAIRLYSLSYAKSKTYIAAAIFTLCNIALPQLCHLIPNGGQILLPIYFFTLLGAYKYGWRVGLLTALLSPIANALLFGMPAPSLLPAIMVKSAMLAIIAGYVAAYTRRVTILSLTIVVLGTQLLSSLFEWAYTGSLTAATQDFRVGLLGMAIQIVGVWALLRYVIKK